MIERFRNLIHIKEEPDEAEEHKRGIRTIGHEEAYEIHLRQQKFRDEIAKNKYNSEFHTSTPITKSRTRHKLPGEMTEPKDLIENPSEEDMF